MKLHPMETMPVDKPILVKMKFVGGLMKGFYENDIYYYVCNKDKYGHIIEDNGEGYMEFSDDADIELLGWVSLNELNDIFNAKENAYER